MRAIYDPVILSSLKGLSVVCDLDKKDQHILPLTEERMKAIQINDDSNLCVWCEKHRGYVKLQRQRVDESTKPTK